MQYLPLWEIALDYLQATDPTPAQTLNRWRSESPHRCTDRDLLAEYGWVVGSCGLTPQVLTRLWERWSAAFQDWQPNAVAIDTVAVRTAALAVMKNPRKVDAILMLAGDLTAKPGQMARLAGLPLDRVLAYFVTLPWVGTNNRYHLARNLGWDVVVRTGPVPRLAAYLQTTPEALCGEIAAATGERIRTVDLVLWNWGHQVGDAKIKELASLLRYH